MAIRFKEERRWFPTQDPRLDPKKSLELDRKMVFNGSRHERPDCVDVALRDYFKHPKNYNARQRDFLDRHSLVCPTCRALREELQAAQKEQPAQEKAAS